MKRKIVAVVLASTMVFGMTACGSSGASDSSSTGSDAATDDTATDDGSEDANVTEGSSDDENTLTVWTWDPNFNIYAIEKAAEIYAKDHPGFKVDVSEIKSDDIETRLTTAVSAGDLSTLPEICYQLSGRLHRPDRFRYRLQPVLTGESCLLHTGW